eukprot:Lankesteria_metandrocarpae@DN4568_c0_g1_i3.p3
MVELSVIVPTYNERQNIPILLHLLSETFETLQPDKVKRKNAYQVVVVDDNSPDKTSEVVEELIPIFEDQFDLCLLKRPGKLGLGSAYIDGFSKLAKGELIALMDADLSHHPKYIPEFIEALNTTQADIVSGSRYIQNGGVCGWNWRRIIISKIANHVARLLLNPPISDLTGAYRIYRRSAFQTIFPKLLKSKGYVFQMEAVVRASAMGLSIIERPIKFVDRLFGSSKLGPNEVFLYLQTLFKLFWEL